MYSLTNYFNNIIFAGKLSYYLVLLSSSDKL